MTDAKLKLKIVKKNYVQEITAIINGHPKVIYTLDLFNDGEYETKETDITIGEIEDLII